MTATLPLINEHTKVHGRQTHAKQHRLVAGCIDGYCCRCHLNAQEQITPRRFELEGLHFSAITTVHQPTNRSDETSHHLTRAQNQLKKKVGRCHPNAREPAPHVVATVVDTPFTPFTRLAEHLPALRALVQASNVFLLGEYPTCSVPAL